MNNKDIKRKLTAILSAWVESRLVADTRNARTVLLREDGSMAIWCRP
jgi:hypothetical protein